MVFTNIPTRDLEEAGEVTLTHLESSLEMSDLYRSDMTLGAGSQEDILF